MLAQELRDAVGMQRLAVGAAEDQLFVQLSSANSKFSLDRVSVLAARNVVNRAFAVDLEEKQ